MKTILSFDHIQSLIERPPLLVPRRHPMLILLLFLRLVQAVGFLTIVMHRPRGPHFVVMRFRFATHLPSLRCLHNPPRNSWSNSSTFLRPTSQTAKKVQEIERGTYVVALPSVTLRLQLRRPMTAMPTATLSLTRVVSRPYHYHYRHHHPHHHHNNHRHCHHPHLSGPLIAHLHCAHLPAH